MLVTLLIGAVIGATLAGYMVMTQNQNVSIFRSQTWNTSMAVTEAGIEDGLQLLNRFAGQFDDLTTWTNYAAGDNWDNTNGVGVYHIHRTLDVNSYDVWITNNPTTPSLTAVANVPWNYQFNTNQYSMAGPATMFAAAGVSPTAQIPIARQVYVQTKKDPLFTVAMAALGQINIKGNNITTDSYDSGDPNFRDPVTGEYPLGQLSRTKAGGDICTDGILTDTLNIGNANIKGTVKTGPGVDTIEIGANGSVGDMAWVTNGNLGIQTGHSATDFNVIFPSVGLPIGAVFYSHSRDDVWIDGTKYEYAFLTSGDYYLPSGIVGGKGNIYVGTNANVRLRIDANVSSSQDVFRLSPSNSILQLFVVASSFVFSGSASIDNQSGHPERFYLFGLPTCTTISLGGNGGFYGCIYAPQADYSLGGGGSDTWDFIGASVTKTVTLNGHFNFHYDENLRNIGPSRGFIPTSWQEVTAK
jgi:hypothetical protein